MDLYQALKEFVEKIANEQKTIIGTVKAGSIDVATGKCVVSPLNGEVEVPEARFSVDVSGSTKYVPKEGSVVVVQMFTPTAGVIIAFSELTDISLNGDNYGGLVIVTSLLTKLNTLEAEINTLKTIFATWVPVAGDGGAALKTVSAQFAAQQITPTTLTDLENQNVKHGSV